ncbi:MAG: hypothetical protein ABI824_11970 [Acidobacteriota bacterium]
MMNRIYQAGIGLVLATGVAAAAADPQLIALSLPDAKVMAGVQIAQARNSPFGQYMLSQAAIPATQLDQLKTLTGFDPRTDLTEFVVSSTAMPTAAPTNPLTGTVLLIGRGSFQPTKISNLASSGGATTTVHKGIYIIVAPNPAAVTPVAGMVFAVAFLDASTVVAGDRTQVEAAIDRWIGGTASSGALGAAAASAGASSQAWMVVADIQQLLAALPTAQSGQANPQAAMIQTMLGTISQVSGGISFGDSQISLHASVQAKTAQDAQSLADALRFLSSLATMQQPAGFPTVTPTFTSNGNQMEFSAAISEQQAESLFHQAPQPAAKARPGLKL